MLHFTVNHIEIERVHSNKLLGIDFTEHLNWNKHVNSITASSYSTIAVLRKLKYMAEGGDFHADMAGMLVDIFKTTPKSYQYGCGTGIFLPLEVTKEITETSNRYMSVIDRCSVCSVILMRTNRRSKSREQ